MCPDAFVRAVVYLNDIEGVIVLDHLRWPCGLLIELQLGFILVLEDSILTLLVVVKLCIGHQVGGRSADTWLQETVVFKDICSIGISFEVNWVHRLVLRDLLHLCRNHFKALFLRTVLLWESLLLILI